MLRVLRGNWYTLANEVDSSRDRWDSDEQWHRLMLSKRLASATNKES